MRVSLLILPVFALTLSAASVPFAYGGVLNAPDARILEHTEIQAGFGVTVFSMEDSSGVSRGEIIPAGFLDVGILGYGQLGMSYLGDGGFVANVKLLVLREGLTVPAFAVGCENMFGPEKVDVYKGPPASPDSPEGVSDHWDADGYYNYDHPQNWSAFGVATKSLQYGLELPLTLNLGIGVGRFVGVVKQGALGIGSSVAIGFFGSVVWEPSERAALAFEQDGKDFNLGFSYDVNRHITLNIAAAEIEMALFPPDGVNRSDPCQNPKFTLAITSHLGPLFGAERLEQEREQQRLARARARLAELEARRRAAEAELQRLRDLLDERR